MPRQNRRLPKLAQLPAAEQDLQELLYRFEDAVHNGAPLAFKTLRKLWEELQLSFIYETRALCVTHEDFTQSLFASALDCLEIPLRPRSKGTIQADTPSEQLQAPGTSPQLPPSAQQPDGRSQPGNTDAISHPASDPLLPQASEDGNVEMPSSMTETLNPEDPHQSWASGAPGSTSFSTGPNLSIAELIASSSEEEEDVTQDDLKEEEHLARVLESMQGPRKKQKVSKTSKQGKAPAIEFGPEDPAWDFLAELPDLAEHVNDDLLEPVPEDLPFNESAYRESSTPLLTGPSASSGLPTDLRPQDRPPEPHTVRVGSIFLLYAIYKAQPSSHKVRIYVPLHLLRGLTWMCRQSPQAAQVLKALRQQDAIVVGAVRRPISGSREAKEAGRSVNTVVHPDRMEQERVTQVAIRQLNDTATDLGSVQHISLLCSSYAKAQDDLFSGHGDIKGLFDMELGAKLGRIVTNMRDELVTLMQPKGKKRKRASDQELDAPIQDESADESAEDGGEPDTVNRGAEEGDGQRPVASRRTMREALSQNDDGDMPSFFLPPQISGEEQEEEEMSDSGVQQLPRKARELLLKQQREAREAREVMSRWNKAFAGPRIEPEDDGAEAPLHDGPSAPPSLTKGVATTLAEELALHPRQVGEKSAEKSNGLDASNLRGRLRSSNAQLPVISTKGTPPSRKRKAGQDEGLPPKAGCSIRARTDNQKADTEGLDPPKETALVQASNEGETSGSPKGWPKKGTPRTNVAAECSARISSNQIPPDTTECSRVENGATDISATPLLDSLGEYPRIEDREDKEKHTTKHNNPEQNKGSEPSGCEPVSNAEEATQKLADALKEVDDILAGL